MKILYVIPNGDTLSVALSMIRAGHEVRFFMPPTKVNTPILREIGDGLITKILTLKGSPEWADLIVVDAIGEPVGFDTGKFVDEQRKAGRKVIGAGSKGELLETDRNHGIEVMQKAGIQVVPSKTFDNFDDAYAFIKAAPGKYVFKPNISGTNSEWTYVGKADDGHDIIEEMQKIEPQWPKDQPVDFEIQLKVSGVEVDVGGYFSATLGDFLQPLWVQFEWKKFAAGDKYNDMGMGFNTGEMGSTHVWTWKRKNEFAKQTLDKLVPYLTEIGFHGPVDLNCIVNEKGIWPLEFTVRFPIPETHVLEECQITPWAELFDMICSGKSSKFMAHKAYGIVIQMVSEGFPFEREVQDKSRNKRLPEIPTSIMDHFHPEWCKVKDGELVIASIVGIPFCITAKGATLKEAQDEVFSMIGPLANSYCWYRPDIGNGDMEDLAMLKKLGYDFDVPGV